MSFWKIFNSDNDQKNASLDTIYQAMIQNFPNRDEEWLAKTAAVCSMMARVSNSDLNISSEEEEKMITALEKWFKISKDEAIKIVAIVVLHTKALSGIENHLYARQLNKSLQKDEKENFIKTLFAIAASDGIVSAIEENEIYNITKELHLTRKEYVAAKMTILEYLGALKI